MRSESGGSHPWPLLSLHMKPAAACEGGAQKGIAEIKWQWRRDHFTGFESRANWLDPTKFRQMAGRAGRAGLDDVGEAIVLATGKPVTDAYLRELMRVLLLPNFLSIPLYFSRTYTDTRGD